MLASAICIARCRKLDKLQANSIIEPISAADWATPVVVVRKKNGSLRLCGDYRSTVNASTKPTAYRLPTAAELLTTVPGGHIFSKIDLIQAYQQLYVDKATLQMLTINTINVLYAVKRLPFGISASPSIFLRFTDTHGYCPVFAPI